MEQRHLLLIDETPQTDRLRRISESLREDGIELIYQEINPNICTRRLSDGNLVFSNEVFVEKLKEVPFINALDVLATDYNLIDDELKGINVIKEFIKLRPYYRKHIILYSAQIDSVIKDIINNRTSSLDEQIGTLKMMSGLNIRYLSSEGEFENKIKGIILREPTFTIDDRITEWFLSLNQDHFKFKHTLFEGKNLSEVGLILQKDDAESLHLRNEIVEQIVTYFVQVADYD